jgi:hypothetical protein
LVRDSIWEVGDKTWENWGVCLFGNLASSDFEIETSRNAQPVVREVFLGDCYEGHLLTLFVTMWYLLGLSRLFSEAGDRPPGQAEFEWLAIPKQKYVPWSFQR